MAHPPQYAQPQYQYPGTASAVGNPKRECRYNRLIQRQISRPIDAMKQFNAAVANGDIPLVLIPKYPMLFSFMLQIPSGLWVLKQKWNAHDGMMDPGLQVFWPAWHRVSHIVTKQAVSYSNPVRYCPTSDNVMVDIDISISFQIGPTEDDAVKFVYSLGAHRFDELLYSLTEEAIRGLVNSVRHDQVHDLREDFAQGMKKNLNATLSEYGVFIHNVKVTDVALPPTLSRTLEETTAFKTRMEEQEKNHENRLRILLNEETQKLTALQKENDRAIQDLLAVKARTVIQRDEMRTVASAKAEVMIVEQQSVFDNKIKEAEGFKEDAVASATAEVFKRKALPAVELTTLKADYEQYVTVSKIKSQAVVKAAEREASKVLANAEAEGTAAPFLTDKRSFDYQSKKIALETSLAQVVPMVISGKNGDDLIRQTFLQTLDTKKAYVSVHHTWGAHETLTENAILDIQPLMLAHARGLGRSSLRVRPQGGMMNAAMMSSARLFSFVDELADDKPALVQRCKETLRTLGGEEAYVKLHLPGSSSDAASANNTNAVILNGLTHCGVIEIHNPAARNALSGRMMAQLADIVTQLEDPEVHKHISVVVLRGTGGWFCAGADLRVAKEELSSRQGGSAMGAVMVDTLTRFRRLPIVSVAVVEGGAYGGGAELTTSCDFRILADNAVIQFVQSRLGVSPGWGGGAPLYKIVGRQHALRLLCTAEKLTPPRAVELGLVDSVYKNYGPGCCEAACIEFLKPFDVVSPEVSHGAKQVITNADDVSLDEVLEFEHSVFTRLWGGPANIKALEGALRKAKPNATK